MYRTMFGWRSYALRAVCDSHTTQDRHLVLHLVQQLFRHLVHLKLLHCDIGASIARLWIRREEDYHLVNATECTLTRLANHIKLVEVDGPITLENGCDVTAVIPRNLWGIAKQDKGPDLTRYRFLHDDGPFHCSQPQRNSCHYGLQIASVPETIGPHPSSSLIR